MFILKFDLQELNPLMANPVPESTEQKERGKQAPSHEKIKAKIIYWISYIAGDMTAFGEWMKGTVHSPE